MKKKEMSRLALLGIAAGVIVSGTGIEAVETENSINLDYVIAKPKCKAHGGCGGLTADREIDHTKYQDEDADAKGQEDILETDKEV